MHPSCIKLAHNKHLLNLGKVSGSPRSKDGHRVMRQPLQWLLAFLLVAEQHCRSVIDDSKRGTKSEGKVELPSSSGSMRRWKMKAHG